MSRKDWKDWKLKKSKKMEEANYKCEQCGNIDKTLFIHHLDEVNSQTYHRITILLWHVCCSPLPPLIFYNFLFGLMQFTRLKHFIEIWNVIFRSTCHFT